MLYKKFNKLEFISAVATSIFIFLFYFILNFNYLTNWIDEKYDSSTYKNNIENFLKSPDYNKDFQTKYNLFNPHHIAIDWFGMNFYKFLKKNSFSGDLMSALQIKNLFISSLALAVLFFLFYKISKKYLLSFLMITMIGFSCAYWIYSQINDTPLIHSVLLCILFMISINYPYVKNKFIFSIILGVFHAINILFHQSDLIFIFVIVFIILFSDIFRSFFSAAENHNNIIKLKINNSIYFDHKNFTFLFTYFFTLSVIIFSVYYYVGMIYLGLTMNQENAESINYIKDSSYFFNWLILYAKIDYWGKGYEKNTFLSVLDGISAYFYQKDNVDIKYHINLFKFFSKESILPNLIFVFFFTIISSSIIFLKKILKQYNFVIIANIIFILLYISFACWWEPDYREFWVAPMFSIWIFSFFILNFLLNKLEIIKPISYFVIYSFIFFISFFLFYFNFIYFIYPNASRDFRSFDIVNNVKIIK
ncbi:MAG: hypothetical protein JXB50_16145 [Spirochaetes bacterium]|nr:hypothetical protein [Spirochaetota bacterium]